MQCLVTQHECGTDTFIEGHPCTCANCVEYTRERAERVAKVVEERRILNGGACTRQINPGDPV